METTPKDQATKRPWKVEIHTHSHYLGCYQIWNAEGNTLTESDVEDEKNRAYIEKAVNCHDELVEALKEIEKIILAFDTAKTTPMQRNDLAFIYQKCIDAKQALAKAQGETN